MFLDLIDLNKLRRGILISLYLLAMLILQNLVFSRISVMGVNAMFIPAAVVAVGMFEGGVWGGAYGLCTGLLCDMNYHENLFMFTALFTILGFLSGMLTQFYLNKSFFSYFFVSIAALIITAGCQMFGLLVFEGADPVSLLYVAGIQVLWSLPFTVPAYIPMRLMDKNRRS